jgi:N-sulfoglucosamine sulfohydrolase
MHEITMYYPMRAVRTRTHKLIWNLAHPLPCPMAGDIEKSPSWLALKRLGTTVGGRTLEQYLHRPAYELFDLEKDPHEMKNVADDPAYADVLKDLRSQLMARLKETNDPWLEGGE